MTGVKLLTGVRLQITWTSLRCQTGRVYGFNPIVVPSSEPPVQTYSRTASEPRRLFKALTIESRSKRHDEIENTGVHRNDFKGRRRTFCSNAVFFRTDDARAGSTSSATPQILYGRMSSMRCVSDRRIVIYRRAVRDRKTIAFTDERKGFCLLRSSRPSAFTPLCVGEIFVTSV